ncbi:MAG: cell division transport system permease protein [Saprospiraceae bacterium]|jgi:cell division transport system permease protein
MEFNQKGIPKRSKPNYLYSIIGVALVLFLIGVFGLIILNGRSLVNSYKEKMNIMVELKNDIPNHEKLRLTQNLSGSAYAKKGSVVFTSKEEAAKILQKDFGEDFSNLGFANPFYDVVIFSPQAAFTHPDSLSKITAELKNSSLVNDVFYQEGLADDIEKNVKKIGLIALIMSILFVFVAITLIHNTIKLALYANRFLIKNMELVGASWGFISRPFLFKSIKNGLLSALVAMLLLVATIFFLKHNMMELESLIDLQMISILFGGILILGILITSLSTYYIVNKYLRMRLDDLY